MKKEDIPILNQLAQSMEEAENELEDAYESGNYEKFNESKKIILKIQQKISEMLK